MMFLYKITEVKIWVSLHEYNNVTFAENEAAAYTPRIGPHRKLILTDILLNFSQTNLKIIYIQKIEK